MLRNWVGYLVRTWAPAHPEGWRQYWSERLRLVVKAALAAVLAWVIAKYGLGQPNPYFAPLAALLGVYPTIALSVREGTSYAAGFLLGGLVAIPVGEAFGPTALGIAVVVVVSLLVASLRALGDQSSQVSFTALFALLFGGHDVVSYVLPRLIDVGVGVVVGLGINALLFPPTHLGRAHRALQELRSDAAAATEALADSVADPEKGLTWWERWSDALHRSTRRARRACDDAKESVRGNPRAVLERHDPRPVLRLMDLSERVSSRIRVIAATVDELDRVQGDPSHPSMEFRLDYARLLRELASLIRWSSDLTSGEAQDARATARQIQSRLADPHRAPGTDLPGLWDPEKELLRNSELLLRLLSPEQHR
ncbi:FUSC family protein [Thermobifida halotolerans]|uniref:FUSC family protein n=1 Tax=Thermobifida halotolerans TaxID=483545 RepID=A0AA97LZI9_9ACTN|nr:aromatic acid exporter family protein [Thermobifida halotolerans]UOE20866.1 FUSC family protein [Thermobifida halotolerans]